MDEIRVTTAQIKAKANAVQKKINLHNGTHYRWNVQQKGEHTWNLHWTYDNSDYTLSAEPQEYEHQDGEITLIRWTDACTGQGFPWAFAGSDSYVTDYENVNQGIIGIVYRGVNKVNREWGLA